MFGRKGLFGRNMGFQTPGIGDGLPGMPERLPDMASVSTTAGGMFGDAMPEPRKSGGFFGKGGVGRAIAGTLGDVLLQRNGLEPMYAPQMQMQQALAFRQAEAQRQRAAELADFERKQQIEAQYRAPKVNDTIADFEWYKNLSPEDRAIYQQMRPVYRQGADGQFYRVDVNNGAPAGLDSLPEGYTIRGGGTGGNVGGGFRP